jgi:hypothetical protein
MKHGKKAKPPGPIIDPNNTQAVRHACGHSRTYTDLPKFDMPALAAEVTARQQRKCRACQNASKNTKAGPA